MKKNKFTQEFYDLISNYPKEIRSHLIEIFNVVTHIVSSDNLISVILLGSTARNEISYIKDVEGIDIFSDYEFIIIVKEKIDDKTLKDLKSQILNLEQKFGIKSPLFHVDFGVSTLMKFKFTPRTLWAFEVKDHGVTVFGEDVKKMLPTITIENLDFGNLNELIIVRLWNCLISLNNNFIYNNNSQYEDFVIKFFYSRNILDILTILLPHNNKLIPGYKNRSSFFLNHFNQSHWNSYKPGIRRATDLKLNPKYKTKFKLKNAQETFICGFINLLVDILDIDCSHDYRWQDIEKIILRIEDSSIFKEKFIRRARRKVIELNIWKNYYKLDIQYLKIFKGEFIRKNLLAYLLYLHISILEDVAETRMDYLKKAINHWNNISYPSKIELNNSKTFEENWLKVRASSVDFMMLWFYSRTNTKKESILNKFSWTEE